jgi:aryl-alcohol dehydrogenase-like predicted oxidoreductase
VTFGRVAGLDKPVSRVCQAIRMLSPESMESSFELLDAAFQSGINTFGSTHLCCDGESDRVFGEWVASRKIRDEVVFIASGDGVADLGECLDRLRFSSIDVFMLNRDDQSIPPAGIIDELNRHIASGAVHLIGAANWHHDRLREANAYAKAKGLTGFAVSSAHYSLAVQVDEPARDSLTITGASGAPARDFYRKSGMPLFPWSPLAGGFFSGRFSRDNAENFTEGADERCVRCYATEDNFTRLDRARKLAAERGVSAAQIALAWVLTDPLDCYPLTAASTPSEAKLLAAAVDIELDSTEREWLSLERDER